MSDVLRLRSLTFVSDTEIDLVLEGEAGETVTWRFIHQPAAPVGVINGPPEFSGSYRQVPGHPFSMWPERLVGEALRAREEGLPAGKAAEALRDAARLSVGQHWLRSLLRLEADENAEGETWQVQDRTRGPEFILWDQKPGETWLESTEGRLLAVVSNGSRAMVVLMQGPGDAGEHLVSPRTTGSSSGYVLQNGQHDTYEDQDTVTLDEARRQVINVVRAGSWTADAQVHEDR